MSLDPDDFNYDYGHWHGDAGISLSVFNGSSSYSQDDEVGQSLRQQELVLKATKIFAHQTSKKAILDALTNELLKIGMPYAVGRYGRLEGLSVEDKELSQNENCLRYLAINLLSEHGITLDTRQLQIIDLSVSQLGSASTGIAYDKTGRLQEFLHKEIARHHGVGADILIDRERMRILLSTARLHLSCEESKVKGLRKFAALSSLYSSRRTSEMQSNLKSNYGGSIKNWRLRHIKPLVWFYRASIRVSLRKLAFKEADFVFGSVTALKDHCIDIVAAAYQEAL